MSATLDEFVKGLGRRAVRQPDGSYLVSCPGPSHRRGDQHPSLHLSIKDGRTLARCFAGCDNEDVLARFGLTWTDLPGELKGETTRAPQLTSLEQLADGANTTTTRYIYKDPDGKPVGAVDRTDNQDGKTFKQLRADGSRFLPGLNGLKLPLYHLDEVLAAVKGGRQISIAEGEKCADALLTAGKVATTNAGGAGAWRDELADSFNGASAVIVYADNDEPGRRWGRDIVASVIARGIPVEVFQAAEGFHDIADQLADGVDLDRAVTIDLAGGGAADNFFELYVDVARMLAGTLPDPPQPTIGRREDGLAAFYAGRVNTITGDPECGKSTLCYAAAVETLTAGGSVLFIDADHNGADMLLNRLLDLGATVEQLSDPSRFRLAEPIDGLHLVGVVGSAADWAPALAVVDSIGEIVPMLGLSSMNPDDYTVAHRRTLLPLARAGACVIAIDHLAKSEDSRRKGPSGTMAKLRAVDGVAYRMTVRERFAPGRGGAAGLSILKDRPGAIRAASPATPGSEQPAGIFILEPDIGGGSHWRITRPASGDLGSASMEDLAELDALDPPPTSVRDIKTRLKWGTDRSRQAMNDYKTRLGGVA